MTTAMRPHDDDLTTATPGNPLGGLFGPARVRG